MNKIKEIVLVWHQWDQMARLFFQNFAIYNIENLHNSISNLQERVQNFAKYLMALLKLSKIV